MKRRIISAAVLMGFVCLGLAGCQSDEYTRQELNITEDTYEITAWKEELPDQTDYSINADYIRGISIEDNGQEVFTVSYEPQDYKEAYDYWEVSVPYDSSVTPNTEELYNLFENLAAIRLTEDTSGITFDEAGLTDTARKVCLALTSDGSDAPDSMLRLSVGSEDGSGNYYASLAGSDQVFIFPGSAVDALFGINPFEYILKIPVLVDTKTVSSIEISQGDKLYTMSVGDQGYVMDGHEVEEDEYNETYVKLLDVFIKEELPEEESVSEDTQPLLDIRFFRNTDDVSDVEISYYPYDDESAVISVNGAQYFLANLEDVENLADEFF